MRQDDSTERKAEMAQLRELYTSQEWARDWQRNILPPGKPAHELACAAIRALPTLLATLESSPTEGALRAIPEGMVLVPKMATAAMIEAAAEAVMAYRHEDQHEPFTIHHDIWSAMLATLTPTETGEVG